MRRALISGVGVVVAAGLVGGGILLGRAFVGGAPGATPAPTPATSPLPSGFVQFRDPEAGFQIAYPGTWRRVESSDPQVRIVATPNGRDSFLVRVIPLPEEIDPNDVAGARDALKELIAGPGVEILDSTQLSLGGVPGWYFLYTFTDAQTDQEGVHSHYFLFNGPRLDIIVFQGLPAGRFGVLAQTFDQIASSYRIVG
jgi:hypothetical protein